MKVMAIEKDNTQNTIFYCNLTSYYNVCRCRGCNLETTFKTHYIYQSISSKFHETFMTTFDDCFDFFEPFRKIAPMSIAKVTAFFLDA